MHARDPPVIGPLLHQISTIHHKHVLKVELVLRIQVPVPVPALGRRRGRGERQLDWHPLLEDRVENLQASGSFVAVSPVSTVRTKNGEALVVGVRTIHHYWSHNRASGQQQLVTNQQ